MEYALVTISALGMIGVAYGVYERRGRRKWLEQRNARLAARGQLDPASCYYTLYQTYGSEYKFVEVWNTIAELLESDPHALRPEDRLVDDLDLLSRDLPYTWDDLQLYILSTLDMESRKKFILTVDHTINDLLVIAMRGCV